MGRIDRIGRINQAGGVSSHSKNNRASRVSRASRASHSSQGRVVGAVVDQARSTPKDARSAMANPATGVNVKGPRNGKNKGKRHTRDAARALEAAL